MNILVIDDDIAKTDLFELLVESNPYDVCRINTKEDWSLKVVQSKPDVIILDISSPDIEDFSICEKIRSLISAPILVVSVIDSPDIKAKALNAGADDVLTKPVSTSLLNARLNGLMKRLKGRKKYFGNNISLVSR